MDDPLASIQAALANTSTILILPHNDPDPDAIGSAVALQYLLKQKWGVDSQIGYRGIIGRAENKALVRYLGDPLTQLTDESRFASLPIALVDTQPGAGNNAFPIESTATLVIDHHPWCKATTKALFYDVRPQVGAAATILYEYLQAAKLELPPMVATALFYGIKTDTLGLGRDTCPADVSAYFALQPRIDAEALAEIEQAQVPADYFSHLDTTLRAARIYDHVVIANIGRLSRPDLPGEMADLLLRLEAASWVITMGTYQSDLILSIRTRDPQGNAGQLVREIVGGRGTAGGHAAMAGGHISLHEQRADQVVAQSVERALRWLNVDRQIVGKPIVK